MKDRRTRKRLGLAALGIFGVYLFFPGPLVISGKKWDCSLGVCRVSFKIRNITPFSVCRKVMVYTEARRFVSAYDEVVGRTNAASVLMRFTPYETQSVMTSVRGLGEEPGIRVSWCWP
jgi:hypothetical protein